MLSCLSLYMFRINAGILFVHFLFMWNLLTFFLLTLTLVYIITQVYL